MPSPAALVRSLTQALAHALLAGPPDETALERAASLLTTPPSWLPGVVQAAVARHLADWRWLDAKDLAATLADALELALELAPERRPASLPKLRRHPLEAPPPSPPIGQLQAMDLCLPALPDLAALADWLGLSPAALGAATNNWRCAPDALTRPTHPYRYRLVPKPDGSARLLEIPQPWLRAVQRQILHDLLDHVPPHPAAQGFRAGCDAITHAAGHTRQPVLLKLDLADYFASIPAGRVYRLFRSLGYPPAVALALCRLCVHVPPPALWRQPEWRAGISWQRRQRYRTPHLPQGAPTSPALANLCTFAFDLRLAGLAEAAGLHYSRYADDLAFSGGDPLLGRGEHFALRVAAIALEEGFAVNHRKTRLARQHQAQHLAGAVVNRGVNVPRRDFDTLKAILHRCLRFGPAAENRAAHPDFQAHLRGRIAHVARLNPARGARLQALFAAIDWDSDTGPPRCG